jgi:fluoride exporter
MQEFLWLIVGCALGGMSRFWLSGVVGRRLGETFPWGTMAVNVSGALAIGIVAGSAASGHGWFSDATLWRATVIGFLGSYTTVSSFSLQTLYLAQTGERRRAAGNIVLTVAACLTAAALGLLAAARLVSG